MREVRRKILLLLLAGVALGLTMNARRQYKVLQAVAKDWHRINEESLKREINNLYRSKLVEEKENPDGSLTYVLTDKGKLKALTFHFEEMHIKPAAWDGKWRIVVFDVPERLRHGRNALREKLKELGFYELQKSVLVFPYSCEDEINFIIEYFRLRKYVRFGTLAVIDNDLHLRKIFKFTE